jgi:hypothetical protein
MATRSICLVLLVLIMACTEDDGINGLTGEQGTAYDTLDLGSNDTLKLDSNFQHCDSVFVATYFGTACCTTGPTVAKPGDTVRYHYQMNHRDAQVSWQILEGDISFISGQETHTVTVLFGPNFTTGLIIGEGNGIKYDDSPRLKCAERVVITAD